MLCKTIDNLILMVYSGGYLDGVRHFYFVFIGVCRVIDFEKYKFAKNDVIYDIETYPNVYTFTYYSVRLS